MYALHALTLSALLCLSATTVLARPSTIHTPTITPKLGKEILTSAAEAANIYVCEHVNWQGKCSTVSYTLGSGDCISLDGTASSIRPDPGYSCTFYKNGSCRTFDGSETLKLRDPGSGDLTRESGGWNDAARGFQCFKLA